MTTYYRAVATLIGQSRIAAHIANAQPMVIDGVAAGDGAGAPITPLETMTGLVREIWRGQPISVGRDPAAPTQVLVSFTIPASAAPACIRELALYAGADCIAVANYPATDLAVGSQGMVNTIDCVMPMAIDSAANVTLAYNPAVMIPLAMLLRPPFIGIDAFLNAPPVAPWPAPVAGSLYVVGPKPLGLFAGHAHDFAEFDGTAYRFAIAPPRTIVGCAADGYDYRRIASGWERLRIGDPGLVNFGSAAAVPVYVGDTAEGAHKIAKLRGEGVATVTADPQTGDVVIAVPPVAGDPGKKGDPGEPGKKGDPGDPGKKGDPGADAPLPTDWSPPDVPVGEYISIITERANLAENERLTDVRYISFAESQAKSSFQGFVTARATYEIASPDGGGSSSFFRVGSTHGVAVAGTFAFRGFVHAAIGLYRRIK